MRDPNEGSDSAGITLEQAMKEGSANTRGPSDAHPVSSPPAFKPAPAGPGRIVHYRLTEDDAAKINRRRTTGGAIAASISEGTWPLGAQAHIGNTANAGDYCPMIVVRCWDGTTTVNGQVFLDGNDTYWVTSAGQGDGNGCWCWPPRT